MEKTYHIIYSAYEPSDVKKSNNESSIYYADTIEKARKYLKKVKNTLIKERPYLSFIENEEYEDGEDEFICYWGKWCYKYRIVCKTTI